jgi:hypothetical protein
MHTRTSTKILMTASAAFLGLLGVAATFLPQEILRGLLPEPNPQIVLIIQITGALYLGFAILNWTARANLIGGIYSRPVALANFLHFAIVAMALLKAVAGGKLEIVFAFGLALYLLFAIWFGLVLFTHPGKPDVDATK